MKKIILFSLIIIIVIQINCIEWNLKHNINSTTTLNDEFTNLESELNYKPEISFDLYKLDNNLFDVEFIYNLNYEYTRPENHKFEFTSKLYRGWLRYSTTQTEIRFGLQKMNFGPAQILRSLQWFSSINPHDPNKTTEGVKALLARYYFINNANIWLWGIWGDQSETSFEKFFFDENNLEFGGRFQYPFEFCEAAFTYHHRKLEDNNILENRFGFDARWDFVIGLWIEAVATKYSETKFAPNWEKYLTLGADYTISIGNGIHILGEYFVYSQSESDFFESSYQSESSAVSFNYPIGLFDSAVAMMVYNWESEDWSRFVSYQRKYDYLSIYLNLLWNSKGSNFDPEQISTDGKSVQLMVGYSF
ncbi:MAG: hypothetical protein K8S23_15505 [Candidatus Cloacimonetes bacterium]|nr:hypothetical protein [Candidatus Cloacimonadota bacterium]